MDKKIFKSKKFKNIVECAVIVIFLIVLFCTDLSAMIFKNKEYKAYKYAIECVENELKYPDSATYPSFKKVSIKKSKSTTEIIISSFRENSGNKGKTVKEVWDITGTGKCENGFGMKLNYRFSVTVVLDESGDYWCYQCAIS